MTFTKDSLWEFRNQIVLGSLFLNDYENDFVPRDLAYDIFECFLEWVQEKGEEMGVAYPLIIDKLDNKESLWEWYIDWDIEFLIEERLAGYEIVN